MDSLGFKGLKKLLKADEGRKVQIKGQRVKKRKFHNSLTSLGSFDVIYSHFSLFLSFKVIKAKKAALVAENAKLHSKLFLFS